MFLNKHLARIENAVRIEDFFDFFHYRKRRRVDRHIEILRFDVADAVFAGDRAAESYGESESFFDAFSRSRDRFGIVAVAHEIDVNIAVAGVSEVGDECVVCFPYFFDAANEFGDFGTRNDDIFVEF